jgi:hypothetical protein
MLESLHSLIRMLFAGGMQKERARMRLTAWRPQGLSITLQIPDFEWVAQVSILRPGFLLAMGSGRNTHSIFVRVIFMTFGWEGEN